MSFDYDVILIDFPDAMTQHDPREPAERLADALEVELAEAALLVLSMPVALRRFEGRRLAHTLAVTLTQLGARVEVQEIVAHGLARSRQALAVPSTGTHHRARLVAAEIAARRGRIYSDYGE